MIELCKKDVIPLMFQLKMRIVCASGALGGVSDGTEGAVTAVDTFRRLAGGGLMVRSMKCVPGNCRDYMTVFLYGAVWSDRGGDVIRVSLKEIIWKLIVHRKQFSHKTQ